MAISSTSIKPGQVLNPKGRPKGLRDKRHMFNEELMLEYHENGDARRVMEVIKKHALDGNVKAAGLFCHYIFFKPDAPMSDGDRIPQDEILNLLTPEQVKAIAQITLKKSSNEFIVNTLNEDE